MTAPKFQIYQCVNPACGFRFPAHSSSPAPARCPRCRREVALVESEFPGLPVTLAQQPAPGPRVDIILDNIRSAWNVGSMFRSADGAGIRHIYLCGITPTPENPKLSKTALGAEFAVPWSYHPDGLELIHSLQHQGENLWALEGGERAISIFQAIKMPPPKELSLIIGNEVTGIDPSLFQACTQVISIPMMGFKRSLNVAIAFGVAVYTLRFAWSQ